MDQDEGINDDIIFSILPSGNTRIDERPSFIINEVTGWITVNVPVLDRETEEEYSLNVRVMSLLFANK